MQTQEGQADIGMGILACLAGLVDEKTGVTDCFVITVRVHGRAEPFYFKEIESLEDLGDSFGNGLV